ncbi:MAG: AAA family ATPase, partial [Bacteroidales bacterium]|nr:AAA family ATPase [Bacteroidales bacterium]
MATKSKTVFFCTHCGNEYSKWMGKCPSCGEWNTLVEKEVVTGKRPVAVSVPGAGRKPMPLKDVATTAEDRVSLGSAEVDRLLGGGIVKGSLVLMGGEPGIGKSTLSLQLPLLRPELKTLYVTGEESVKQVKMRADRLGGDTSNCLIYSETDMGEIIREAEEVDPDLLIVDSVQTMYCPQVESTAGSVSQIKEVAATLLRFAKASGVPVILIGHITKEGTIAGPKILEHIVDVVLQFEGEN